MPEHLGDAQIITFMINWIHDPLGFDNYLGNSQNVEKCYTYSFITKYKGQGASQEAVVVKNSPANAGDIRDMGWFPGGKIPWRRAWQPTPVFLPGESQWADEPNHEGYSPGGPAYGCRLQPMGLQRVRHD